MTDAERAIQLADEIEGTGIFQGLRRVGLTAAEAGTAVIALRRFAEQSAPSPAIHDAEGVRLSPDVMAELRSPAACVVRGIPDAPSPAPADLREVVAEPPGRRVVRLGHGKYAISTGTYYDVPAVFIEYAPSPGPTGGNVPPEEREKIGYSAENAVIFTHQDDSRVQVIANLMCGDSFDAAISAAGYVILPREPTEAMERDGFDRLCDFDFDHGGVAPDMGEIYRAMVRAALAAKETAR